MRRFALAACLALAVATAQGRQNPTPSPMNALAEQYVKTVLALGQHDADYVDAYYGPPEWKKDVESTKLDLDAIAERAQKLRADLKKLTPAANGDEMATLRWQYLDRQLSSLEARVRMLKGEKRSFDDESKALYDAVAPTHPASHFQEIVDKLEKRFPGQGSLAVRYDTWRKPFVIAKDKLDQVFQIAIKAGREKTAAHVQLPANESFTLEYVTNKPWGG
jgi:hypothetical protein